MASMDHLYQPQYRPSFSADQQKIDDWLTGVDSLNTPDINPDFFNESNLFKTEKQSQSNLMAVSSLKSDALIDDYMYTANSDLTLSGAAISTSVNLDRSATYSPTYSDKQLDSQTININSPEMMPVSPNKVCPQMDQIYYDDSTVYPISLVEYDGTGFVDTSYTPSRSSSISTGSSDHHQLQSTTNSITTTTNSSNTSNSSVATYLNEYLLSSHDLLTDSSVLTRLSPQSPASSQYSTDDKTFTNLDAVPSVNLHQLTATIKQEPLDQYQPTVVAEYETGQFGGAQAQYGTINTTDLTNYYQPLVQQQQQSQYQSLTHAQVQQVVNHTQPPTTTLHHNTTTTASATNGRKRNSHAAFSAPSTSGTSTASGSKKPRMTKREKQKMMESDISKFENENHDLRNSIDLLERQIQFCKRFLSENVAPVIQRQQQQQQQQLHQFGSPQMVVVEAM